MGCCLASPLCQFEYFSCCHSCFQHVSFIFHVKNTSVTFSQGILEVLIFFSNLFLNWHSACEVDNDLKCKVVCLSSVVGFALGSCLGWAGKVLACPWAQVGREGCPCKDSCLKT